MGVGSSSLVNLEEKEEILIKQQITLEKNKIYNNRERIYINILKNNINENSLIVEGNIDIIYNEVLKLENECRKNIRENLKEYVNTYLDKLLWINSNDNITNIIYLSIDNNKIDILDTNYKDLIIIKDSGIKKLPIVINKKDEEILRNKGFINNVIQECLTTKKRVLEDKINTMHNTDIKKRKITLDLIDLIDILPNKKVDVCKTSNETNKFISLINKMTVNCNWSCVNTIIYGEPGETTILVEGYNKKIIDKFIESLPSIYHIGKKGDTLELLNIVYYDEEHIDIYNNKSIIDYYTYIDDEIIPIIITIKDEINLRKLGLIGNVIKDCKCSRLLLENL
jgi:hypothetical protein